MAKTSSKSTPSEIRKHYFSENYVIITPGRGHRPDLFSKHVEPHKASSDHCPFDHNDEPSVWQTPRGDSWRVKVIRNAFPALSLANPHAFGVQEVVINTPRHDAEFSELSHAEIMDVFTAYRHRLTDLSQLEGIRYVLIYKNDGPIAGATVPHAHCQILALPMIPPKIERETDALNHYWDERGQCAYCDVIIWESSQKVRIIAQDKHFFALAPYAASNALEAWLLPKRHVTKFAELHISELDSLAVMLKKITARLDADSISFNYFLQESLPHQDHHFVLKVEPRTTRYAGAEIGTGIEINPVAPEYAALWYQGKIPRDA